MLSNQFQASQKRANINMIIHRAHLPSPEKVPKRHFIGTDKMAPQETNNNQERSLLIPSCRHNLKTYIQYAFNFQNQVLIRYTIDGITAAGIGREVYTKLWMKECTQGTPVLMYFSHWEFEKCPQYPTPASKSVPSCPKPISPSAHFSFLNYLNMAFQVQPLSLLSPTTSLELH